MKLNIKKYTDDLTLTWEERYKRLEAHHLEESLALKSLVEELKAEIDFFIGGEEYYAEYEEVHDFSDLT